VVTADQMETLKAQSLADALAYTPGIVMAPGYANSYDVFFSRGFRIQDGTGNVYRDGLRLGGSGWATGQQEVYGLERVELLKGAASVLFGAAAPGGVLNTVTKRPQQEAFREVKVEGGNYDGTLGQHAGDVLGPRRCGVLLVAANRRRGRGHDPQLDHIAPHGGAAGCAVQDLHDADGRCGGNAFGYRRGRLVEKTGWPSPTACPLRNLQRHDEKSVDSWVGTGSRLGLSGIGIRKAFLARRTSAAKDHRDPRCSARLKSCYLYDVSIF
jgi:hypothetical protein